MKLVGASLVLVVVLSGCACSRFTNQEMALIGGMTVAQMADWHTTSQLGPNGHYECNPVMGRHPDQGTINDYFISSWLIKVAVAWMLPHKARKWWLGLNTAASAGLAAHNSTLPGVELGFSR